VKADAIGERLHLPENRAQFFGGKARFLPLHFRAEAAL
jgi:hypothetical protein